MTKLYSLFAGTTTDTEVKAVAENQIIQMEGYSYDRYVVHKITHDKYGYHYHLINLRTLDIQQSEIIKPLSQKFGIGMYYDESNIEFMSEEEVIELYTKAKSKEDAEQEKERLENERRKAVREIGCKWLNENLPEDAKAIVQDYYMRMTTFFGQYRAIGTNYNQIVKALKSNFTEKKALAFLYKLEKATLELVTLQKQMMELTDEFERKYGYLWLQK